MQNNVQDEIFNLILSEVIKKLIASLPFFSIPLIKPIFIFIITKLAWALFKEMQLKKALLEIDIKIDGQVRRYEVAKKEYEEKPDDNHAKEVFRSTVRDLIRF